MDNFGLNGSVLCFKNTDGALCFICEEDIDNSCHFFLDYPQFEEMLTLALRKLKVTRLNPTNGNQILPILSRILFYQFYLNCQNEMLLVIDLSLLFDNQTTAPVKRFLSSAVGKVNELRTEKLRELEAFWLTN